MLSSPRLVATESKSQSPTEFTILGLLEKTDNSHSRTVFSVAVRELIKQQDAHQGILAKTIALGYAKFDPRKTDSNFARRRMYSEVIALNFGHMLHRYPRQRVLSKIEHFKKSSSNLAHLDRGLFAEKIEKLDSNIPIETLRAKFASNEYDGLAAAVMHALVTNDRDTRLANMCIAKNGQLKLFDGDCTFWNLMEECSTTFSSKDARGIRDKYVTPFWFGAEEKDTTKALLTSKVVEQPHFIKEGNKAALKYLILPKQFIQSIIPVWTKEEDKKNERYIKENIKEFINNIKTLRKAMLTDDNFLQFLLSDESEKFVSEVIKLVKTSLTSTEKAIWNAIPHIEKLFHDTYEELQDEAYQLISKDEARAAIYKNAPDSVKIRHALNSDDLNLGDTYISLTDFSPRRR